MRRGIRVDMEGVYGGGFDGLEVGREERKIGLGMNR